MQASLRSSDYQHHKQQQQQQQQQQQYYGYATNVTVGAPIECVTSLLRQHQSAPQDYIEPSQESGLTVVETEATGTTVLPHQALHTTANHLELLDSHANLLPPEQLLDQAITFSATNYDRYLTFNHHHHQQQQQHHGQQPLTNDGDDETLCSDLENQQQQQLEREQYQLTHSSHGPQTSVGVGDSDAAVAVLDAEDSSRQQQQQQQQLDYGSYQTDQSVYYELTAPICAQDQSSNQSNIVGVNLNINDQQQHQQQKIIELQEMFHQHHYDATTTPATATTTATTMATALLPEVAAVQQQTAAVVQLQSRLSTIPDDYHQHHQHQLQDTNYHQHQHQQSMVAAAIADVNNAYSCGDQVASSLAMAPPEDQVQLSSHLYAFNYSAKTYSDAAPHQDNHSCYQSLDRVGEFNELDNQRANMMSLVADDPDTSQRQHLLGAYNPAAFPIQGHHDHHLHHPDHHYHLQHHHHHINYQQLEDSMKNHGSNGVQVGDAGDNSTGPQFVTGHRFQQHHHHESTVNNSTGSASLRDSYSSTLSTSSSSSSSSSASSSAASIGSDVESVDSTMPRDEKKAKEANIPLSYNEIVNLSIDQFNEHIARFHFTEAQLTLMRDIRRRGKNKVAAQTCRRRKMEQITELQHELNHLANKRLSLSCERSRLTQEHCRLTKDYEKLYSIIQNHMN